MKKLYLTTAAILVAIPSAFASTDVEAVAVIKTASGPVRIPASQFNDKQHTLHVADDTHDEHGVRRDAAMSNPASSPVNASDANPKPITSGTAAPARQFGVLQNKGKFYVVDSKDGSTVTDIPAFDPKGYPDNASAWGAIAAAAMATTDNAS